MDGADLMGRTIRVSIAQPNQLNKLSSGGSGPSETSQAVWSNDEWFQQHVAGATSEQEEKEHATRQQDQSILTEAMT